MCPLQMLYLWYMAGGYTQIWPRTGMEKMSVAHAHITKMIEATCPILTTAQTAGQGWKDVLAIDVKEKLIEILRKPIFPHELADPIEAVADYLLDSGVTVQECGYWVSLTDCANAGVYCSVCNKKVYKEDYAWCNRKNKLRSAYCPNCGAKMMPEPPKGE